VQQLVLALQRLSTVLCSLTVHALLQTSLHNQLAKHQSTATINVSSTSLPVTPVYLDLLDMGGELTIGDIEGPDSFSSGAGEAHLFLEGKHKMLTLHLQSMKFPPQTK
jgi:hypothetical protein